MTLDRLPVPAPRLNLAFKQPMIIHAEPAFALSTHVLVPSCITVNCCSPVLCHHDTVPLACIEQPRYLENMPHDRHVDTESPMAHS